MAVFTYSRVPAFNPNTSPASVAKSATGNVYDIGDTGFTTPLNMTMVATNTVTTTLVSDANGMFPDFTLVDRTSVVFKSGSNKMVLTTTTPIPGPPGAASTVPGPPGPATTDASLLVAGTVADARLPVRLSDGQLAATYAPASGSPNYAAKSFEATVASKANTADVAPKWKASTAYLAGAPVLSPLGDVVTAKVDFTSGASYSSANWNLSPNYALVGAPAGNALAKWAPSTSYGAGVQTISPDGDIVSAKVAFTSGATYNAADWNPSTQDGRVATLEGKVWAKPALASGTNLNTVTAAGTYPLAGFTLVNSMTPALPAIATGTLEVFPIGISTLQRWTTSGSPRQTWVRVNDSGTWMPWRRMDRDTRTGIIAVTRSQGTTYGVAPALDYGLRHPIRIGVRAAERFRVTLRSFDERTGTAGTATLAINGVWIGEAEIVGGELTGQFKSAPFNVSGALSVSLGTAVSTPWIDWQSFNLKPGVDYLISFGYTSDGTGTLYRTRGYLWGNAAAGSASQAPTVAGLTPTNLCPLMVQLEMESPAPRIAMVGDSHVTGANARYPVSESPSHLFGIASGTIPVCMGLGGSTLTEWRDNTLPKWAGYAATGADAVMIWLGQNDVFNNARTLAQMQDDFRTVVNSARITFPGVPVYAGTIMPRNTAVLAAEEQIRKDFNAWLITQPSRISGVWDAAAAVTDPATGLVRAEFIDADNVHLTVAGCNAVANTLPFRFNK